MNTLTNIVIEGSKDKPITLDVNYKETQEPKPIIIFVHGFKGFKDWAHFNVMAQAFAENDFVFVKFNFSYNGTTPQNPAEFVDLDAFGNNNYTIELNDLKKVIDWVTHFPALAKEINRDKIYLIGHSRGGGISVLKAGEDDRIKKLVTWASVSDFLNRNKQLTIKTWKEIGVVFTINARTKQQMPLYLQFYENLIANKERLNILKAAKKITIPFLIVHGTEDEAVALKDAEELHIASNKHSKLVVIDGANHTFGVKHPFDGNELPEHAQLAITKTMEFLKK